MKITINGRVAYGIRVREDYPRCGKCDLLRDDDGRGIDLHACHVRKVLLSTPEADHHCEGSGRNPNGDLVFKYADENPGVEVEWMAQRLEGRV